MPAREACLPPCLPLRVLDGCSLGFGQSRRSTENLAFVTGLIALIQGHSKYDAHHLQDVILSRDNNEEKRVSRLLYHLDNLGVRSPGHRLPVHADETVADVQAHQYCGTSVFHRFDENSGKQKRLRTEEAQMLERKRKKKKRMKLTCP